MTTKQARTDLSVRPYRDDDEAEVLKLLVASLGAGPAGRRPPEFFRWKHLQNPFGRSFMTVGECDGLIVGFRSFLMWSFSSGQSVLRGARGVDTATHPDYQGRGIFSALTRHAVEALRMPCDLIFNTPNDKSLPGYLKLGWTEVGNIPVSIRVRRPMTFLREIHSTRTAGRRLIPSAIDAPSAADVLERPGLESFLQGIEFADAPDRSLTTPRSLDYVRWRYGRASLLDYRALAEEANGTLRGLAIFRVRPRGRLLEASIAELLVESGDVATARRLLKRVLSCAPIDHATCHFAAGTAAGRAARRTGFASVGRGIRLLARPLKHHLTPDPCLPSSWALSLGDLEVF
jgi:GNAT superfamily N-acetyltransferase